MPSPATPRKTPGFALSRPYPGVILLSFRRRQTMALTLLRFQEHYESPRFKGTVFTLAQYKQWYTSVRGSFSYADDWAGFNFPDPILEPFKAGRFNPLTPAEREVLKALAGQKGRFYVIATAQGNARALEHELAHAFYYLLPAYRRRSLAIQKGGDFSDLIERLKEGEGYDPMVFKDEIQAILAEKGAERRLPQHRQRCLAQRALLIGRLG
jgi:hypothetical protein